MARRTQPSRLDLWMNGSARRILGKRRAAANASSIATTGSTIRRAARYRCRCPLRRAISRSAGRSSRTFSTTSCPTANRSAAVSPRATAPAARRRSHCSRSSAATASARIQMLPPDEEPADLKSISGRALSDSADRAPVARHDIARRSSASTNRSTICACRSPARRKRPRCCVTAGRWLLPEGSTPTTHIFKLPLGLVGNMRADMRTSVENEWLCSKIVAAYGLPIARCEIAQFDDQKVLVVERFDRRLSSDETWIVRLPQEDMCQATGTPALHKYRVGRRAGHRAIMEVLSGSDARGEGPARLLHDADDLLAARRDRRPREELQHRAPARQPLRIHSALRRAFRASDHRPGANQFAAQTRETRDGRAQQERPLPAQRDPAAALDRAGQRVGFAARCRIDDRRVDGANARGHRRSGRASTERLPVDVADAIFDGMRRLTRSSLMGCLKASFISAEARTMDTSCRALRDVDVLQRNEQPAAGICRDDVPVTDGRDELDIRRDGRAVRAPSTSGRAPR